jgi:hypothetical protein
VEINRPVGVLLPIHETYYGDINPDDLNNFLACAEEALRAFGFSRIETLNPDTDRERELWGVGEILVQSDEITSWDDGKDVGITVDWLDLIDADSDEILKVLESTWMKEPAIVAIRYLEEDSYKSYGNSELGEVRFYKQHSREFTLGTPLSEFLGEGWAKHEYDGEVVIAVETGGGFEVPEEFEFSRYWELFERRPSDSSYFEYRQICLTEDPRHGKWVAQGYPLADSTPIKLSDLLKLSERAVFVHSIVSDPSELKGLLSQLGDALTVGYSAWLCTDAEGREGFHIWRTKENLLYEAGVHIAQFGVQELKRLGVSDRFEKLREALDIETKKFPVTGGGVGMYSNVEFLKSTGWFE